MVFIGKPVHFSGPCADFRKLFPQSGVGERLILRLGHDLSENRFTLFRIMPSLEKHHSMSSRVANSVLREAQAVIAAIITACTASTR